MTVETPTSVAELSELADADLEALLLIRRFEELVLELFAVGELNGTTHTCLGQEYVPVALAALLPDDFVFSNHRGHGHYLAHIGDPEGLLAELMGRAGGVCNGVGGSQHLYREGRFLSTGVQGESLSVALGVARHFRYMQQQRVAVVYLGDGTWGEGAVYEALNMASLWRVPLLVVVEHNGIAQSTPTARQLAGTVADRARAFAIDCVEIDTCDVNMIRTVVEPVVSRVRQASEPAVLQFNTIRLGPHSKGDDTRSADELAALRAADWCERYAARYPDQFARVDATQRQRVTDLTTQVAARPLAPWDGAR